MKLELAAGQDGFDAEAQRAALQPGADDTVFALAGAGDHVLALLGAAPKVVFAVDARPAQAWLVELKVAALKSLAHGEYLELFGAKPSRRRRGLYQRVRWLLSADADAYWSANVVLVDRGLIAQGRRERALAGFRRFVALVQGTRRVDRFLELADPAEQAETLRREWEGFVWRKFAGRVLAGALGRPEPAACLGRLEEVMTATPARDNYLLSWLLAGRFVGARPFYLREDAFDALKLMANRVVVLPERPGRALAGMPDGSVDVFALGDAPDVQDSFVREAGRAGRAGARLAVRLDGDLSRFEPVSARAPARLPGADRTPVPGCLWAITLAGLTLNAA